MLRLERPVTGIARPSGPKMLKKSQKGLSGPTVPKKKRRKSRKSHEKVPKRDFFVPFFFDFFGTFLALGTTFLRLFRHFGPGGPGTPCNWSLQSQSKWANQQNDIFGVNECLLGCSPWNHLNGLLGPFTSLP